MVCIRMRWSKCSSLWWRCLPAMEIIHSNYCVRSLERQWSKQWRTHERVHSVSLDCHARSSLPATPCLLSPHRQTTCAPTSYSLLPCPYHPLPRNHSYSPPPPLVHALFSFSMESESESIFPIHPHSKISVRLSKICLILHRVSFSKLELCSKLILC